MVWFFTETDAEVYLHHAIQRITGFRYCYSILNIAKKFLFLRHSIPGPMEQLELNVRYMSYSPMQAVNVKEHRMDKIFYS